MQQITIGDKAVGQYQPVFIIAEIGSNHDGNLEQAKKLIDVAAEIGADAVKFQAFKADSLSTPWAARLHQAFQKHELPREWLPKLAAHARERKILFLCTPFDEEAADLLFELDVPAFKVASGDLTHLPLLRHLARSRRPILLSAGMAYLSEVEEAIRMIQGEGNGKIVLLHCVSIYPAPPEDANLRAMATMEKAFRLPVGFSDHSPGTFLSLGAVALGACLIEKHLTLSRNFSGPDHAHSLEPPEFARMVEEIRELEKALGNGVKEPQGGEHAESYFARRGLYAKRDIPEGTVISQEMIEIVRPCATMEPKNLGRVVGRVARQEIPAHTPITWEVI